MHYIVVGGHINVQRTRIAADYVSIGQQQSITDQRTGPDALDSRTLES